MAFRALLFSRNPETNAALTTACVSAGIHCEVCNDIFPATGNRWLMHLCGIRPTTFRLPKAFPVAGRVGQALRKPLLGAGSKRSGGAIRRGYVPDSKR